MPLQLVETAALACVLQKRYPQLRVHPYEIYFDSANARLFERMADAYRFEIEGVPTAFLGDRVKCGQRLSGKFSNASRRAAPRRLVVSPARREHGA